MSSENQDGKVLLQKRLIHFLEDESKTSMRKFVQVIGGGYKILAIHG